MGENAAAGELHKAQLVNTQLVMGMLADGVTLADSTEAVGELPTIIGEDLSALEGGGHQLGYPKSGGHNRRTLQARFRLRPSR